MMLRRLFGGSAAPPTKRSHALMTVRSWLGSGKAGEFAPGVFVIRHRSARRLFGCYHGLAGPAASERPRLRASDLRPPSYFARPNTARRPGPLPAPTHVSSGVSITCALGTPVASEGNRAASDSRGERMIRVHRAEEPGHTHCDVETLSRVLAAVLAHEDRAGKVAALRQRQARRY